MVAVVIGLVAVELSMGHIAPFVNSCNSSATTSGELHAEGAGLVAVETFFDGIVATHGGFGFLAVLDGVKELGNGHRLSASFPGGEVLSGGVFGVHGVLCGVELIMGQDAPSVN